MDNLDFDVPIPKGYRIFFRDFSVAGIDHYLPALYKAIAPGSPEFLLEAEPDNPHDPNAIKVVVVRDGWLWDKRYQIGYVPRDIAEIVTAAGLGDCLLFRPRRLWQGHVAFRLYADLVGPEARYNL